MLRELKHDHAKEMAQVETGAEPAETVQKMIIDLANKIAKSYKPEEAKAEAK